MLGRSHRLTRKRDFEILNKEGRFAVGKFVVVKSWKIDELKYEKRGYSENDLKIGFVVGKKVHKSAVKRNRIKRQMREVVRLLVKKSKLKNGFMLYVSAKPSILEAQYSDIERDMLQVLKKARVLV